MHLALFCPCNFIKESQKYLRGHPGQASRAPRETTLYKKCIRRLQMGTDIKSVQLYVRERANGWKNDGWKDGNDRERPNEKKLKDSISKVSGEALAQSDFLFYSLHNTGTKPCVPTISNLKTISAEKNKLFSHVFAQVQPHQTIWTSMTYFVLQMCFLLFWEVIFVSKTVTLTTSLTFRHRASSI